VSFLYQKRLQIARERFAEQLKAAHVDGGIAMKLANPAALATNWQRLVRLRDGRRAADTMRQRGNNFIEHTMKGFPPVLHIKYETLSTGASFARPVNYALLRIVPPEGIVVDPKRRPYVIIDPRGGHGPGIGGFKDDSQVGIALREGQPVYFVIFFRDPEPGQTPLDVCEVEKLFVRKVRELHPGSPKPAIIRNCQAGWAAMMLAASDPDDTGPIVINGAPMSYWRGAWREGAGNNRCATPAAPWAARGSRRSAPT
jgi:hypothetical protein